MATVRQSGGDYGSLNAALAAAETTIDIDQSWTAADTANATCSTANTTITVSGAAKHAGRIDLAANHYRLDGSGSGHRFTNSATGTVINGIVIRQVGTGTSDECIRASPATGRNFTIRNSILTCTTKSSQQDCVYTGFNAETGTNAFEQCVIYGAGRSGINSENANSSDSNSVLNVNSCIIYDCGDTTTGGGIKIDRGPSITSTNTCNIHNSAFLDNSAGSSLDLNPIGATAAGITWNISNSIDSDNSIAGVIDSGSNNLANRTITDNASPGAGDWVVVENLTTVDLRLKSSAENDAQDRHATATAHSLTIPATDIVGTARPQNTNYDVGPFEIAAGAATVSMPPRKFNPMRFLGVR